jgi:hypothetical protein
MPEPIGEMLRERTRGTAKLENAYAGSAPANRLLRLTYMPS